MVIKYPHKYVNPCWCDQGSPLLILFQIINQFVNFMQVEYLPVMVPTEKETKIPHEFANRVRSEMAKALSVVCTGHFFLDIKLALAAQKLNQPLGRSLVEFPRMEKLFHLDYAMAQDYLKKLSAMDVKNSGLVTYEEFLKALNFQTRQLRRRCFTCLTRMGMAVSTSGSFWQVLCLCRHIHHLQGQWKQRSKLVM